MKPLIEHLPTFYREAEGVIAWMAAWDPEIEALYEAQADYFDQLTIDTATWGLARWWEPAYGIRTDRTKTTEERRAQVLARIRGQGTATRELILSIACSFYNGQLSLVERFADYAIDLNLEIEAGDTLLVESAQQLAAAIGEVLPAHIACRIAAFLQSHGRLSHGAFTEVEQRLEVYPLIAGELESGGSATMAGALEYRTRVEVYPSEKEE